MRKISGFTLIELVATMLILGIISVVLGRIMFHAFETFQAANDITETDWTGFVSLTRIVDDLRTMRSANNMTSMQSSALSFIDVNGNSVQYQLSGTSLLRNSQIMATGIAGLSFTYLDKNGATTGAAAAVNYIKINLIAAEGNLAQTFSTMAAIRN